MKFEFFSIVLLLVNVGLRVFRFQMHAVYLI